MGHGHGHGHGAAVRRLLGGGSGALSWPNNFGGTAGATIPSAPLDGRYIIDNPLGLDSVEQVNGRARLTLLDNYAPAQTPPIQQSGKSIFWTNSGYNLGVPMYGRSDGVILMPPFDVVARGVRYGTTDDPLTIPSNKIGNGNAYDFMCVQASNPASRLDYTHIGLGPRAGFFTCEVKRNNAATNSWVGQVGAVSTDGVDLRMVAADHSHVDLYWRNIGDAPWNLATLFGTEPDYGTNGIKCSLVMYGFGATAPFSGYVDYTEWGPTHPL